MRTSAVVTVEDRLRFLIDTGPDLRQQILRTTIRHIDAVLYTHPHADHLHGIDDLRGFCFLQKAAIPVFGNDMMISHIEKRFAYVLNSPTTIWDKPAVIVNRIAEVPFTFQGVSITPIPIIHGNWPTLGYRIGNMAYITDVSFIPESSYALLQDLDVLFLSCLRPAPHPTHFGVEDAIAAAQRIAAKKTIFIHMTHELEYQRFSKQLPEGIEVGYDGIVAVSNSGSKSLSLD
jgi:phosphoribosyl 1,2-cyclic phosphate phosphodiesterase